MDPIKEAFSRIKQDISELKQELIKIKQELTQFKENNTTNTLNTSQNTPNTSQNTPNIPKNQSIKQINQQINPELNKITPNPIQNSHQLQDNYQHLPQFNQTIPTQNPTINNTSTDNPTQNPTITYPSQSLKLQNIGVSIGNRGVPTDKQTNRQTNQQTDKYLENNQFNNQINYSDNLNKDNQTHTKIYKEISDFERAKNILDSLDSIKKEIRLKFKRLTPQEMSVFSTLYSLQEQNFTEITYKLIANNLNLSESSIRDYINKLIKKGIPIQKIRQNNKKITLSVSQDLEKIASLSTIKKLIEL